MLVAQSIVYLWSDQWYLITPKPNAQIIGDKLVIQMGTDFDSLVIQWGQAIPSALAKQEEYELQTFFSVYEVVELTQEQKDERQKAAKKKESLVKGKKSLELEEVEQGN